MSSFKLIVAAVALALLTAAQACPSEQNFAKVNDNIFSVERDGKTRRIKLEITIADWRVDCTKTRAVVWGQTTKKMPLGAPPFASVYVIDLRKMRNLSVHTTTRGPFEVVFNSKQQIILVDEMVIDFKTGRITSTSISSDLTISSEECADFRGRRFQ
jgi:hypothetical protein